MGIISEKEEKLAALAAEQKKISEKIQKWQQKLKILSDTSDSLKEEIGPLIHFRETKLNPLIKSSASLAEVEKKLNHSVDSHFENSTVNELTSLDHVTVPAKIPKKKIFPIPPI